MPKAALITPLTNFGTLSGPGHSALLIGTKIWSFGDNGSWSVFGAKSYMTKNGTRPVVVQEFDADKVDSGAVHDFVKTSKKSNEWYIFSGVCSTMTAMAIDSATSDEFDPDYLDTPIKVAQLVEKKKLSVKSYIVKISERLNTKDQITVIGLLNSSFPSMPIGVPHFYDWKD